MKYWLLQQKFLIEEDCLEIREDTEFRVGETVKFRVIRQLGEGASCLTYYAENASGNMVVVKEFCPAEFRKYAVRDEDGTLRMEFPQGVFAGYLKKKYAAQKLAFQNECLMQRQLQKQNLISGTNNPELYIGGPEEIPYIVMNCDGEIMCLEDMREFQVKCAEKNADYVTMILRALRAYATEISLLHTQGMLLMDIKPGNLLITSWNQELMFRRIIDYGSVKSLEEIRRNSEIQLSYTMEFAAPEIKEKDSDRIGYASDIFSFGLTVIQFLTGRVVEADDLHLLYLSDEHFKRNILQMAEETGFTAIQAKDERFFHLLNLFVSCTLSENIDVEEISSENEYAGVTERYMEYIETMPASQCRKRLKRMEDVIGLLTLLIGDNEFQYGEVNLSHVLQRVQTQGEKFKETYYGPEAEKEFGRQLFSQELLPRFVSVGVKDVQTMDIMALVESECHSYIEAESGLGKTSALKDAYANCLKKKQGIEYLPVWIPMGQIIYESEQNEDHLLCSYICSQLFGKANGDLQRKKHWDQLEQWMDEANTPFRLLLLCDGMNEACWQKQYRTMKEELLMLMGRENVTVILSGQNQRREFAEYRGRVWQIEPLQECSIRDYLEEKLPIWHKDKQVQEKIEAMFATLTTPCLLHYFCIPFLGLTHIPASSIPNNEAQIMEQYLCGMDYCVQNKIHAYVAEYPGQTRPEFGAHLVNRVAGAVCWQMAYHGELYATAELMEHTVESSMRKSEHDVPMIENMPVREHVYQEKIRSLSWCSYLFEYHDSRFYIIHESYRNFLAAKYLAEKMNSQAVFPEEFWSEIPTCVMKYLSQLVTREQMLRLRKHLLKQHGTYLGRQMKREFVNDEMVSEFFEKDDEMAGENLCQMIQMSQEFSALEKKLLCIRIPRDFFKEPGRVEAKEAEEPDFAQYSEKWEFICRSTARWLQEHGLPGAYAERIVLVLSGGGIVYPDWNLNDKICKISDILSIPVVELVSPMKELNLILEQSMEKEASGEILLQIAARFVLQEMEECNRYGKVYERLRVSFDEEMIKQISLAAGYTFFTGDFYFQPELVLRRMLKRKTELYLSCEAMKMAGANKGSFVENEGLEGIGGPGTRKEQPVRWDLERYFSQTDGLKERDVTAIRRQEGTLTLLKQFVLLEYELHQKNKSVIDADAMIAFAQLFLMMNDAVCHGNLAEMSRLEFEKRITRADCSECLARMDLQHACLLLGCFDSVSLGGFCKAMAFRVSHYKIVHLERLKRKHRLLMLVLAAWMIWGCMVWPELIPILAACAILAVGMKILEKDGLMIFEFVCYKIFHMLVGR